MHVAVRGTHRGGLGFVWRSPKLRYMDYQLNYASRRNVATFMRKSYITMFRLLPCTRQFQKVYGLNPSRPEKWMRCKFNNYETVVSHLCSSSLGSCFGNLSCTNCSGSNPDGGSSLRREYASAVPLPAKKCLNKKVRYRDHNSPPMIPILSQTKPINYLTPCFFQVFLSRSIILLSTTRSPRWSFTFYKYNFLCLWSSLSSNACCILWAIHFPYFIHKIYSL
jgi:hypothetical protein